MHASAVPNTQKSLDSYLLSPLSSSVFIYFSFPHFSFEMFYFSLFVFLALILYPKNTFCREEKTQPLQSLPNWLNTFHTIHLSQVMKKPLISPVISVISQSLGPRASKPLLFSALYPNLSKLLRVSKIFLHFRQQVHLGIQISPFAWKYPQHWTTEELLQDRKLDMNRCCFICRVRLAESREAADCLASYRTFSKVSHELAQCCLSRLFNLQLTGHWIWQWINWNQKFLYTTPY